MRCEWGWTDLHACKNIAELFAAEFLFRALLSLSTESHEPWRTTSKPQNIVASYAECEHFLQTQDPRAIAEQENKRALQNKCSMCVRPSRLHMGHIATRSVVSSYHRKVSCGGVSIVSLCPGYVIKPSHKMSFSHTFLLSQDDGYDGMGFDMEPDRHVRRGRSKRNRASGIGDYRPRNK